MGEDDYDLLPHKEIVRLRDEIEELKKQLSKKGHSRPSIQDNSTAKLSESINELLELFKTAGEDLKAEDHHATHQNINSMDEHLENLNRKMTTLIAHNEEIAKGILALAELIKEQARRAQVQPVQRPVQRAPIPQQRMQPRPPQPPAMPSSIPNQSPPQKRKREFKI